MTSINTRRVLAYIVLTLGVTWGLMLLTTTREGRDAFLNSALPPSGMLVPAFIALLLEVFLVKESRLYFRTYTQPPRLIVYAFLLLTILVAGLSLLGIYTKIGKNTLGGIGNLLFVLWTLMVIRVYRQSGEASFEVGGLQLGNTEQGVKFVIGIVLFFLLQAGLNLAFGLGKFQGIQESIEGIPVPGFLYPLALVGFFALAVIGSPLGGLAATFGEEYGWRGFLQRELSALGLRKGSLLVGLVWGTWHIPIILSGAHTYPPSVPGFLCAYLFFGLWGFVQSYAVLKTGSIWTAAFLHGVVNNVYAFTLNYLVRPDDKLISFGLGIYGLACMAAIVFFILRDPIWNTRVNTSPTACFRKSRS
jgi:membrane protease YdiL (CAAX protease family)